jgi:catechol 2,3-dioxygenase-like lactoylglutathione lyase family enzyme
MIFGAHMIVYSADATADRAFFKDVLGYPSVDAGHGWLIFALPPAEMAVHPTDDEGGRHEVYFMCDDLRGEMDALSDRGVTCTQVEEARWGSITRIRLPGGGTVGLYQPKHPTALSPSTP